MPMDAVADAPIWPTMAASMYSTAVTTICCRMDGMLKCEHDLGLVCRSGTCSPRRILRRELLKGRWTWSSSFYGSEKRITCPDRLLYYYKCGWCRKSI